MRVSERPSGLAVFERELVEPVGIWGEVHVQKWDKYGDLIAECKTKNLVTQVGDQYYGDRAARIVGSALTPNAATNATTSLITTTAAHGLAVGDVVLLAGMTPSGYNGLWVVTSVTSATQFGIYVATALGAGTGFGTVTPQQSLGGVKGMKLGTGSTAVAKTGAGAGLVTYLTDSQQAIDSTWPQSSIPSSARQIQYKVTYAAGKANSPSTAITEIVLILDFLADATSTAANTIARALLAGIGSKQTTDTLTATWNHNLLGA